ncbi:MAG: long-chain fatty acid--CoA ligase [Crocinitomicaceae bacterium]|nr:long-chain fatty acid--CoA ligase [Crocinitomicaceae bacterium]
MNAIKRLFDIPYFQLANYPSKDMFVTKENGSWNGLSTEKFLNEVMLYSKGLLGLGIEKGDTIALVSNNRFEWNIMDIAIQQIGAIVVPLYPTISESDYNYILNDASIKACIVSSEELATKIKHIESTVPSLKHLFTFDKVAGFEHWSNILQTTENSSEEAVNELMQSVKSEDLATIIYTSGTTGNPKGVMLSHANIISTVLSCVDPIPVENGSKVLSFLPICHIYERMLHYLYMYLGCSIHFAESMDTIGDNIREVKPEVFSAVPRLIEKVYDKIIAKGEELKGIKRSLFFWAVNVGEEFDFIGKSRFYKLKLAIARKLIFSKWQLALGGNVNAIASGSAALQPRLARMFHAAGIPILEGYGLTETSPVVSVNCFKKGIRIGAVGALVENVQVKIAEDGEILVKGPNVMMGYYNLPEETAAVFDEEGWFKTGDIGEFTEGKFLKITDRKKEIFKTSGGKYIVPQAMENKFKESRFIEQIMVIGEGQKYPAALVIPNFAFLKEWAIRKKMDFSKYSNEELIKIPTVIERFNKEIKLYNQGFGNWEQVKKIALLPSEFTIESGEITPTLKLKRKKILENNQEKYDQIYTD